MKIFVLEELLYGEAWAVCEVFSTREKAEQRWDKIIDGV